MKPLWKHISLCKCVCLCVCVWLAVKTCVFVWLAVKVCVCLNHSTWAILQEPLSALSSLRDVNMNKCMNGREQICKAWGRHTNRLLSGAMCPSVAYRTFCGVCVCVCVWNHTHSFYEPHGCAHTHIYTHTHSFHDPHSCVRTHTRRHAHTHIHTHSLFSWSP